MKFIYYAILFLLFSGCTNFKLGDFTEELKSSNYLDFKEWGDGSFCIPLTEYFDDVDIEEYLDSIREEDLADAETITKELILRLGSIYDMIPKFEEW